MLHDRPKKAQLPKDDTYYHKGLRKQLVTVLREKGISDERVLAAIEKVPRHFFLDTAFERIAYEDRAFPIAAHQTISQPYTVAYQSALLSIQKFDKVLEIGTGSAYQSIILAELGAQVFTIERQKELFDLAAAFELLQKYPSIRRFYGDGYEGLPSYGPFNKIIITAAAPFIPPRLVEQLKPGGIMVLPLGDEFGQKMTCITKSADGSTQQDTLGDFNFVPMLEGRNQ